MPSRRAGAKAAVPHLRRSGAIVMTGSVSAIERSKAPLDYSLTKGGIHAFTKHPNTFTSFRRPPRLSVRMFGSGGRANASSASCANRASRSNRSTSLQSGRNPFQPSDDRCIPGAGPRGPYGHGSATSTATAEASH